MKVFTKIISILLFISTILLVIAIINFILIYYIIDSRKYSHVVIPFEFTSISKYHKQFYLEKEGEYIIKLKFYRNSRDVNKDKSIGNFLINHSNYNSWPIIIKLFENNSVILNSDSLSCPGYNNEKESMDKYVGLFDGRTDSQYKLDIQIKSSIPLLNKTKCELEIAVSSSELLERCWNDYADRMISAIILLYLLIIFYILFLLRMILGYKKWLAKMISRTFTQKQLFLKTSN